MKASEFLKIVILFLGLIFLLALGFIVVAYFLGYFNSPLSEWTLGRFTEVISWLFLIAFVIIGVLIGILVAVQQGVKERGPPKSNYPSF